MNPAFYNWRTFLLSLLTLSIMACSHSTYKIPSSKMVNSIKDKVPGVKAFQKDKDQLPGHYSSAGPSLKKYVGASSGSDLYMFPDETYIYTEWADIMPNTIHERGTWRFDGSIISLVSDNTLTTQRFLDSEQLPLVSPDKTILLMGRKGFDYFQQHSSDKPDFMLSLTTLEKVSEIKNQDIETIKNKLLKEAWMPWFFAEGFPPHSLKVDAFNKSDIVAIIKTIAGHENSPEEDGGIQIRAKVICPIKGTKTGDEITIFYAAGSLQGLYIANLVWDQGLKGYRYYDPNMDIELIEMQKNEYINIHETMKNWGFEGEPVVIPTTNKYYLPDCKPKCDNICQRKFEYVQYMIQRLPSNIRVE